MKRFCFLLILLFLCSCSEFFDERQSLSLSEKGEFVTKTVLKTSSSKVTQDEVIDYLSFREGIVADGIKSITRYDFWFFLIFLMQRFDTELHLYIE